MIIRALRVGIEHLLRGESNFSIRILTFLPDNVNIIIDTLLSVKLLFRY